MNTNKNAIKSGNKDPFEPKPDSKVSIEHREHPIEYPNNLTDHEYHELIVGSAIHPALIKPNFFHIEGETIYDYLFISNKIPRKNAGRVTDGYIRQYQHLLLGGTWIQSLDPFKNWQPMEWGRIKPNFPRFDWQTGKLVKYESPPKTANRVTYFDVPNCILSKIARRYNVSDIQRVLFAKRGKKLWLKSRKKAAFGNGALYQRLLQLGQYQGTLMQIAEYSSRVALCRKGILNPLIFWLWVKQHKQKNIDRRLENVDCRLRFGILHKPLAFKQGKIYNLPSNINNKSTIYNLNSLAPVFQAGVNLQSTIGNLQSVDSQQKDIQISFWEWIKEHPEIPIILCEGEKKAACLLSMGFVAMAYPPAVGIALPGIWNGRVGKQDFDERLHPDLVPMAQAGRKFIILFDYETKAKTRWSVFQATVRTAKAIESAGCGCEVALLPGPEKGVDDFVMERGKDANALLTAIINDAKSLKDYQRSYRVKKWGLSKYKPDVTVNIKYLTQALCIPDLSEKCSSVPALYNLAEEKLFTPSVAGAEVQRCRGAEVQRCRGVGEQRNRRTGEQKRVFV